MFGSDAKLRALPSKQGRHAREQVLCLGWPLVFINVCSKPCVSLILFSISLLPLSLLLISLVFLYITIIVIIVITIVIITVIDDGIIVIISIVLIIIIMNMVYDLSFIKIMK